MAASNGPSRRRRIAGERKPGQGAQPPAAGQTPPAAPPVPPRRPAARTQSEPVEAESVEAEPLEAGPVEAGPVEAEPVEAGPVEAGAATTGGADVPRPPTPPRVSFRSRSEDPSDDADLASTSDRPGTARRVPLKVLAPFIALAVLAVLIGGAGATWGYSRWDSKHGVDAAHDAAADAAADAAETIFTYDYTSLDAHLKKAQALMTPAFAKKFATISPALDELAPQRKIQVKAESRDAAPVPCGGSCDRDSAKILLFVDQARLADGSKTPTVFGNRITMSMVHRDGRWLVSNVGAL